MKTTVRNGWLGIDFIHDGKRIRRALKMKDTPSNRQQVKREIIPELEKELVLGKYFKNQNEITLNDFTIKSFEMNKATRRALTNKQYQDVYRLHIQPTFGDMFITDIKRSDLLQWQNHLLTEKGLAGKTIKNIRAVFMTILQDALKDELIEKNYLTLVDQPKIEPVIIKKPFTVKEMYQIIDNAPKRIKAYFAIGFFTGMRTGEIIALKWSEVNFEDKIINVRHSIRDGNYTEPKTKSSIRDIEILGVLMPYLIEHKQLMGDSEFVFETQKGKAFRRSDKISSHYWKPTLDRCGIEYRNLYQMRHTFASQMLMHNEDILWVSQMLGHKDSSTTLQNYAKYIPDSNVKRASFLDKNIGNVA